MRAGRPLGTPQPASARAKIGAATKIRWKDPAYRARMVALHTGRMQTPEHREANAASKRLPIEGEERRHYLKLRWHMGAKWARAAMGLE